jgi:hypothetical protein
VNGSLGIAAISLTLLAVCIAPQRGKGMEAVAWAIAAVMAWIAAGANVL